MTTRQHLARTYLEVDPRSLGLGRIVLGLVMLADLLRRIPWIRDFYSNDGLLPNHTLLWQPPFPRIFSVFFMASLPDEAAVLFLLCFAVFFLYTVGYRTRLMQVLAFAAAASLHNRVVPAENWGSVAMGCLLLWTMFLPLGRRFSVDAVLASLRARPGETPDELRAGVPGPDTHPVRSLAVLALLLQLAVIYYFNFVHKSGATWRDGSAVHYVLWQERIVTTLGVWARTHLPPTFWQVLTWGTLIIEASAPVLLLAPLGWVWTRLLAIVLLAGLHLGIALLVNLGIFSAAMLAYYPFLLAAAHWELVSRFVPKQARARQVFYDSGCGVCFAIVRVLARLDVHRRLTWLPNDDAAALPRGLDAKLVEDTIVVVDPITGRQWLRAEAIAEIFAALPLGRLWSWPMRLPIVSTFARLVYDRFARNRARISAALGLAACGLPSARPAVTTAPPITPARAWVRARLPFARELVIALLIWVNLQDVLMANAAVPRWLRVPRPGWMLTLVQYPRLFQGWSMFSPEGPRQDFMVYVDAVTREGRHVDPFNEVGSRVATLPVRDVPVRLGHDSFFCDYSFRLPHEPVYHQAFLEWILRYPRRTGRPADEIVSFEAHVIEHRSPSPGGTTPTDVVDRVFLTWPR